MFQIVELASGYQEMNVDLNSLNTVCFISTSTRIASMKYQKITTNIHPIWRPVSHNASTRFDSAKRPNIRYQPSHFFVHVKSMKNKHLNKPIQIYFDLCYACDSFVILHLCTNRHHCYYCGSSASRPALWVGYTDACPYRIRSRTRTARTIMMIRLYGA